MRLSEFSVGDACRIQRVHTDEKIKARLQMLGIEEGVRVEIAAFSAFKKDILLLCGPLRVGMRRTLAERVEAVKID